jgi:hypothetical protein
MSKYQRRLGRALKGKSTVSDFQIQAPAVLEHWQEQGSTAVQGRDIHCSALAGGHTVITVRVLRRKGVVRSEEHPLVLPPRKVEIYGAKASIL